MSRECFSIIKNLLTRDGQNDGHQKHASVIQYNFLFPPLQTAGPISSILDWTLSWSLMVFIFEQFVKLLAKKITESLEFCGILFSKLSEIWAQFLFGL